MKKDDYFVICHNILNYLYSKLKDGTTTVECSTLAENTKDTIPYINEYYYLYVVQGLLDEKYIIAKQIENEENVGAQITPKGIEYLFTHPMMKQAKEI